MRTVKTKEIPEILYHYTTMEGLIGIIESKTIWASDLMFLNDSSEYIYAIDIFREAVEKLRVPKTNALIRTDFDKFIEDMDINIGLLRQNNESSAIYVSSFSTQPDLLSQWRGYCPKGGVSIGFDGLELQKIISANSMTTACYLSKYEYDKERQLEVAKNMIEKYNSPYIEANDLRNNKDMLAHLKYTSDVLLEMIAIAPMFKNDSFKDESEWRLVSNFHIGSQAKFRSKNPGYLIPYLEIKLADDKAILPINEIIIAPNSHKELARHSVQKLVNSHRIVCNIKYSDIPYRG